MGTRVCGGPIQPDVIHSSRPVPNLVVRGMRQPMDCPGTGRSHVWLYTLIQGIKLLTVPFQATGFHSWLSIKVRSSHARVRWARLGTVQLSA
jgi:hypothetical protein